MLAPGKGFMYYYPRSYDAWEPDSYTVESAETLFFMFGFAIRGWNFPIPTTEVLPITIDNEASASDCSTSEAPVLASISPGSITALAVGGIMGVIGLACLIVAVVLFRRARKLASHNDQAASEQIAQVNTAPYSSPQSHQRLNVNDAANDRHELPANKERQELPGSLECEVQT